MPPLGRVLIIAGSDSGGGAGIQADIKTVTALGGYAATAITAITVQNTLGVSRAEPVAPDLIAAQARAVLEDIGADVIKTGMLGDAAVVEMVARLLDEAERPAVIDPVMVAKGGARLLADDAIAPVRSLLVPRAALLTPNAPEAEALTGIAVATTDDLRRAGEALLRAGAGAVLMKGGHVPGPRVVDVLMTPYGETTFEGERIETRHTHGTGCTLASAVATGLAQGQSIEAAAARAWDYVHRAILQAPGLGRGAGPLDHGWTLRGEGLSEDLEARLEAIVRATPSLMTVLETARDLALPDWMIFSGAVYQRVLNHLTDRDPDYGIKDYDLGYFDASDISYEAEDAVIRRVAAAFDPPLRDLVEVRNQARVHVWFEGKFGEPYAPLSHTAQALERFTSTTFSVGVRLEPSGGLTIAAPFGLEDLFALRLAPNPTRKTNGFARTAASAVARWPELRVTEA